jgi:excisionase family DNA binding protein
MVYHENMASDDNSMYMTVRETAQALDVHENTIRNWARTGVIRSSKVPGSTHLRFERAEVSRLQRERGRASSQVGPALRTDGPELVTAVELARWADRRDSKDAFPDLMRRLLADTPGITDISNPAYEGVAAPGWDARATSVGSAVLPAGELRFEFGTDKDPKHKAESDYSKREADPSVTYVQVTPRNWAGAKAWADEKSGEGKFASVRALNAQDLELWLIQTPNVHYWISERLGFNPRGAWTIEKWGADFLARTQPELPAGLFLAGRNPLAEQLRTRLSEADKSTPVTIQADWKDEALAFVFAALTQGANLIKQTLVVEDPGTWDRLLSSRLPLVLIPKFDASAEIGRALAQGHHVIVVAGADDVVRDSDVIRLPKVDRSLADESLKSAVPEGHRRQALAALARRSMPALYRSLDHNPKKRTPDWVHDREVAPIVVPLVLADRWADFEGDLRAIEELTSRTRDDIERTLESLRTSPDAPFIRSAGGWRLAWPVEAALLALPTLTSAERKRWADVVERALLEPDPYSGMTAAERFIAEAKGTRPEYSDLFRKALARGLALAASVSDGIANGADIQHSVDGIVRGVLAGAETDESGMTWVRIATVLPDLAEASPAVFLRAIEEDLDRPEPLIAKLFTDSERDQGIFGPSSAHPSLLWALETLCWSKTYFAEAAMLLARLVRVDPGGRLSNRPAGSLHTIASGWIRNTGADREDKVAMIEHVLRRFEDVGWPLTLAVLPAAHMVSSPPREPAYRDWVPSDRGVSYAEWGDFVKDVVRIAIQAAGKDARRWSEIAPGIDNFPPAEREVLLDALEIAARDASWSAEERYLVWGVLRAEIDRHEEFPDADWSLTSENLEPYRSIAALLEPRDDARLYAGLFDWRSHVAGIAWGEPGYEDELLRQQVEAITTTLGLGREALTALAREAKSGHRIGQILAQRDDAPADTILSWLNLEGEEEKNLRQVALVWADFNMATAGLSWLKQAMVEKTFLEPRAIALLSGAAPFDRDTWPKVAELGAEVEENYWLRAQVLRAPSEQWPEAVDALLEHGQAWKALELHSYMRHEKHDPDVEQVKRALRGILSGSESRGVAGMDIYYVEQAIEFLENNVPDDHELPQLEFALYPLFHDGQPSNALYRALGSDPSLFVDLVQRLYRAENEPKRAVSAQDEAFSHVAWTVLREWRQLPGQREDGTIDGSRLMEWVRTARLALSDSGRGSVGDEQIGEILASSPVGADGAWPSEEVRDVIENLGNARIDTGVEIGHVNRRGITTRDPFEGGTQERSLETRYREDAAVMSQKWPRTARILRVIADSYRGEGIRHDLEAEHWGDEG